MIIADISTYFFRFSRFFIVFYEQYLRIIAPNHENRIPIFPLFCAIFVGII